MEFNSFVGRTLIQVINDKLNFFTKSSLSILDYAKSHKITKKPFKIKRSFVSGLRSYEFVPSRVNGKQKNKTLRMYDQCYRTYHVNLYIFPATNE